MSQRIREVSIHRLVRRLRKKHHIRETDYIIRPNISKRNTKEPKISTSSINNKFNYLKMGTGRNTLSPSMFFYSGQLDYVIIADKKLSKDIFTSNEIFRKICDRFGQSPNKASNLKSLYEYYKMVNNLEDRGYLDERDYGVYLNVINRKADYDYKEDNGDVEFDNDFFDAEESYNKETKENPNKEPSEEPSGNTESASGSSSTKGFSGYDEIDFEDVEDEEVKRKLVLHFAIERNAKKIKLLKNSFIAKNNGELFCEICGFNFYRVYGEIGNNFIEAHHIVPLSVIAISPEEYVNDLENIILVCSNCHRMLHRYKHWLNNETKLFYTRHEKKLDVISIFSQT